MKPLRTVTTAAALLISCSCVCAKDKSAIDQIKDIASSSSCRAQSGAPRAYARGVALVYAKAVCEPERSDVKVVSAAKGAE